MMSGAAVVCDNMKKGMRMMKDEDSPNPKKAQSKPNEL